MAARRPFPCLARGDPRTVGPKCNERCLDQFRQIRLECSICPRCLGKAHTVVANNPIYDKNYFSIGAHRGGKFFAPLLMVAARRDADARVSAAGARQSGLRAVWASQEASWRRKPGRRPRWATGGCPPPGADRRPGCARSGGENRKFPPRRWLRSVPRGQPMATWQHGIVVSWHRLVSGGAAQAGMGNQLSTPTEK